MIKRIFGFILFVILLCVCNSAFAATININRSETYDPSRIENDTNEFRVYKIFDVYKSADGQGMTYFMKDNNPWRSAVSRTGNVVFNDTPDGSGTYVTLPAYVDNNETTALAFATAFKEELASLNLEGEYAAKQLTPGTPIEVEDGYYLVISDLGENMILATSDINITEKNDYPDVVKTVSLEDKNAEIGSEVHFEIIVTVPSGANKQIVLTDTMSNGLTFGNVTSVINNNGNNVDCEVSPVNFADNSFSITFNEDIIKNNQGKNITISYCAYINNNAIYYMSETNEVQLQYSNTFTTIPVSVEVETDMFRLLKYDNADAAKNPIASAVFQILKNDIPVQLYKVDDYTYRIATYEDSETSDTFVTADNEMITVYGLDRDEIYELQEITPPAGYNLSSYKQPIQLSSDNELIIEFPNSKGTVLPSTGGAGTTGFLIGGTALTAIAGAIYLAKKKSDNDDM